VEEPQKRAPAGAARVSTSERSKTFLGQYFLSEFFSPDESDNTNAFLPLTWQV
jgi:hypothetical protein